MRSIPPVLLSKIKEQNQTIYNNAQPKMSVTVARAKSSVRDSTYFTIEKIREKEGITDVAVSARRMKPIGPPDRIYGIHIDNGVAKTSLREYPDKLKEHWKPQFDVESAIGVSIVFDGRWHMNSTKKWGLVTDELPWIFWIDDSNVLKGRIWDAGEIYVLATDVVKVDTIRGWIPAQAGHTDDQGIIAAYVKTDGKIYYRNFCMQSTGLFIWEIEKEMTDFGTGCVGVRVFRSNDFRVGFLAEKPTGNIMAVTVRNWAGMSIAPESLHARVSAEIDFIPIERIDVITPNEYIKANLNAVTYLCPVDKIEVVPVSIDRPSATELTILFDTDLYNVNIDGFEVVNDTGTIIFEVELVTFNSTTKLLTLKLTTEMDANLNIKVTYTGDINNIRVVDKDYCKLELNSFELIHDGHIPPQDGYLNECLTASVGATITYSQIFKLNGYSNEYLSASVGATIQLWNVDDAPI